MEKKKQQSLAGDVTNIQIAQLKYTAILLALALAVYFIFPGFFIKLAQQYEELVEWFSFRLLF